MVAIMVDAVLDDPCPRAGVTVTGLLAGDQVVTVWRTADGERAAVRGARAITVVDSLYVEDYEAPLGRVVSYALDVVSGSDAGAQGVVADVFIESDHGYIQDPSNPASAVPILGSGMKGTVLRAAAFGQIAYDAEISRFNIMGSNRPVAISGPRGAPTGVPLELRTMAESENVRLRDLVSSAVLLVIRPLPQWGSFLPGSATYAAGKVVENPVLRGGLTRWQATGDIVRGSSARVVVALWSYQDVAQIFATYDQKQLAAGGSTYLDDQKNPANV